MQTVLLLFPLFFFSLSSLFSSCHFFILLAQGLLQSLLSLQVSVAMPYYGIVIGFNRRQLWLSLLAQGLLQSVPYSLQVSAWGNAILQYCNGFNRLH